MVETNYIQNAGAMILKGDKESQTVVFNELVAENSFWNESGALPNDMIKEIDGVEVTLGNANNIFGEVHGWKPGREVRVVLERNGDDIVIEKSLTPTYTAGKQMKRNADITQEEKELLESWLKGS
jgi:C-terminal processing protease CtpA/Prc